MPKLGCPCGETINLSPIPNPHSFLLFEEQHFEELVDLAEASAKESPARYVVFDAFQSRRLKPEIVECPTCGRLALFKHMSDRVVFWYAPEEAVSEGRIQGVYRAFRSEQKPNQTSTANDLHTD